MCLIQSSSIELKTTLFSKSKNASWLIAWSFIFSNSSIAIFQIYFASSSQSFIFETSSNSILSSIASIHKNSFTFLIISFTSKLSF